MAIDEPTLDAVKLSGYLDNQSWYRSATTCRLFTKILVDQPPLGSTCQFAKVPGLANFPCEHLAVWRVGAYQPGPSCQWLCGVHYRVLYRNGTERAARCEHCWKRH